MTTSIGTGYGFGTTLDTSFAEAVEKTTAALKDEGFGVLTTIDVKATMKEKLDLDREPYMILGACNPTLAHRALEAEPEIGLLLPCNVIVHEQDGKTVVSIVDPNAMLGVAPGNADLQNVAAEASERLRRVVVALERSSD